MKKPILRLLAGCALAGLGYWTFHQPRLSSVRPKPAVAPAVQRPGQATTAVVTPRNINFGITAAGEIGPLDSVSVRPEIGGLISKLPLDIGDKVKKGDVLFELNDKDLQTEKTSVRIEIAGASLAVQTQTLMLEKAKLNFERVKSLFDNKLVSHEVFDNARLDYELAKNSLDVATNRLETARTALQTVEDKLIKTVIRAPFDSTILARPVSVGQAVSGASGYNSGTEVYIVANLADMIISAHVNQSDVTHVKVGQAVTVEVEAVPGLKLTGYVDRIAPLATIKSGVKGFATRIRLKNAEELVRPGMTANLTIPLIAAQNLLTVPLAAVFNENGERYVYLRREGEQLERQPVQLGLTDYDFAQVIAGLKEGDIVSLVAPQPKASNSAQPSEVKGSGKADPSSVAKSSPGAPAASPKSQSSGR